MALWIGRCVSSFHASCFLPDSSNHGFPSSLAKALSTTPSLGALSLNKAFASSSVPLQVLGRGSRVPGSKETFLVKTWHRRLEGTPPILASPTCVDAFKWSSSCGSQLHILLKSKTKNPSQIERLVEVEVQESSAYLNSLPPPMILTHISLTNPHKRGPRQPLPFLCGSPISSNEVFPLGLRKAKPGPWLVIPYKVNE